MCFAAVYWEATGTHQACKCNSTASTVVKSSQPNLTWGNVKTWLVEQKVKVIVLVVVAVLVVVVILVVVVVVVSSSLMSWIFLNCD